MKISVNLNGTDVNPFHKWNLTQNPFPQIGKYEYDAYEHQLNKLGGDPIPSVDYIRETLKGFSDEFVELCVRQFKPGEYVTFHVFWKDPYDDFV